MMTKEKHCSEDLFLFENIKSLAIKIKTHNKIQKKIETRTRAMAPKHSFSNELLQQVRSSF